MTILPKIFQRKPEENLWSYNFFSQKFSPKMFVWKYRRQLWQPCQKNLNRSPKKNYEIVCFFNQKSSPTMFLWYIRIQFWQPFRKVFDWSPQKIIKMKVFFQKKNPLQCFSGEVKCSFDNFAENFPSEDWKNLRTYIFFQTKFSPRLFLRKWWLQLW